jgi:hypothetical protein
MEDLLRRAAERYPLKDSGDKWEEISANLALEAIPELKTKKKKNRNKIFFLLLLGLLLAPVIVYLMMRPVEIGSKNSGQAGIFEHAPHVEKSAPLPVGKNKTKEPSTGKIDKPDPKALSFYPTPLTDKKKHNRNSSVDFLHLPGAEIDKPSNFPKNIISFSDPLERTPLLFVKDPGHLFEDRSGTWKTFKNSQDLNLFKNGRTNDFKYAYYGFYAGPIMNSVETYGLRRPGFDLGLEAGYRFNRKLAIEGGVYFKKNYYRAMAAEFSKKEISGMLSGGRQLNEVHGSYALFDVPVNLRFDLLARKDQKGFVAAGISTYVVTRESNWYLTTMNGTDEMLYGNYENARVYPGAMFNLSIGYERKVGAKTNLRIQPYIQLPSRGIGVGNVSMYSTGVHVGFSKKF